MLPKEALGFVEDVFELLLTRHEIWYLYFLVIANSLANPTVLSVGSGSN